MILHFFLQTARLEAHKLTLGNMTLNNSTSHVMSAPYSMVFDPPWNKFISSSLVLEKESTVFLASQPVAWPANDSSDPLSTTRSLEDKFFGNIEPLRDPATGKYNKTLKISTNPTKFMENLTTYNPETTQFLELENNSSTYDYWFSGSMENSSFSTEMETDMSDRDNNISTIQIYSDGYFNSNPTNTTSEVDENSTPFTEQESSLTKGFTDRYQSSTTVESSSKNITGSITVDSTSPVTFRVNESVTSSNKFDNQSVSSNPITEMKNSTPAANLSGSTNAGGTNLSHNTVPLDGGEMYMNGSFPPGSTCSSAKEGKRCKIQ